MVVLQKPPVKLMSCTHGQFCLKIVQIFNFLGTTTKVLSFVVLGVGCDIL